MYGIEHGAVGWGGLSMMLLWLVIIVLIVAAVRFFGGRSDCQSRTPTKSAREILDARYASGEIDRDEYLKRRDDLME